MVPEFWTHNWRPVQFTLVVDNFGVKYVREEHGIHLKNTIEENYTVTTEWDGRRYIGIMLDWDYNRRLVHLSMPNYFINEYQLIKLVDDKGSIHIQANNGMYGLP